MYGVKSQSMRRRQTVANIRGNSGKKARLSSKRIKRNKLNDMLKGRIKRKTFGKYQ